MEACTRFEEDMNSIVFRGLIKLRICNFIDFCY